MKIKSSSEKKGIKFTVGPLRWLSGRESTCQAGDTGLIPGLGGSPGEGNGNALRYSCLGNSKDREVWRSTVDGVANELDMTE